MLIKGVRKVNNAPTAKEHTCDVRAFRCASANASRERQCAYVRACLAQCARACDIVVSGHGRGRARKRAFVEPMTAAAVVYVYCD